MNEELPPELKLVEPLLHDLGYEWSTHCRLGNGRIWSLVNSSTRKAGRVGMNVAEAQKYVLELARYRLKAEKKKCEEIKKLLIQLLGAVETCP